MQFLKRAHGVRRNGVIGKEIRIVKFSGDAFFGIHDVQHLREHIRAIFRKEEIIGIVVSRFPQMRDEQARLARRHGQAVFPQIAVFHVVVQIHRVVVRRYGEHARVSAENAFERERDAVVAPRDRAVRHIVRQQRHILIFLLLVQPQKRVSEQRRRIAEIRRRVNQRRLVHVQLLFKRFESRAIGRGQIRLAKVQFFVQPHKARGKFALRMIVGLFGIDGSEKRFNCRVQFRRRVRFAVFRQKERVGIHGAFGGKKRFFYVQKFFPLRFLRQIFFVRLLHIKRNGMRVARRKTADAHPEKQCEDKDFFNHVKPFVLRKPQPLSREANVSDTLNASTFCWGNRTAKFSCAVLPTCSAGRFINEAIASMVSPLPREASKAN